MEIFFKPKISTKVEVGGIITSPDFAVATIMPHANMNGTLYVGEKRPRDLATIYDQARASALYVVEEAYFSENQYEYFRPANLHEQFRVWCVTARRLKDRWLYDPQGEHIIFFQHNPYHAFYIANILVVGKMERYFR